LRQTHQLDSHVATSTVEQMLCCPTPSLYYTAKTHDATLSPTSIVVGLLAYILKSYITLPKMINNIKYQFFKNSGDTFNPFYQHQTAEFTVQGHTFWSTDQYVLFVKATKYGGINLVKMITNIDKGDMLDQYIPTMDLNEWNDTIQEAVRFATITMLKQNRKMMARVATHGQNGAGLRKLRRLHVWHRLGRNLGVGA